jgi:NADPH2:quinone reductase
VPRPDGNHERQKQQQLNHNHQSAITYSQFGDTNILQLNEVAIPSLGKGEVLVKLHNTAVNPSDVKLRAGQRAGVEEMPFPEIIPHSDGSVNRAGKFGGGFV